MGTLEEESRNLRRIYSKRFSRVLRTIMTRYLEELRFILWTKWLLSVPRVLAAKK